MDSPKLNLGLLLDTYLVPAWIYTAIERTVDSEAAQFSLVVLREPDGKVLRGKGELVARWYTAIDEKVFVRGSRATEPKSLKKLLAKAAVIPVKPIHTEMGYSLREYDLKKIKSFDLDILIRVGFDPLCGQILSCPCYGVWEYFSPCRPYGYWEVMQGSTSTQMAIRMLPKDGGPARILFSAAALTYPFSPARNANRSLWKAASFLPRQLGALGTQGEERYFQQIKTQDEGNSSFISDGKFQPPSIAAQAGWIGRLLVKNAKEMLSRKLTRDAWFLMYDLSENEATPFHDYRKIIPPPNRFWADPHVVQKDNSYYIFFEEFDALEKRGHISVLTVNANGQVQDSVPVLKQSYHLSYPCVFEWNGRFYMVPESSEHRTIDLYECVEFPTRWVHKKTLMDHVNAVDSTLIFYQGKWWLFTGISENEAASPEVELFLFYTEDLLAPEWKSHPLNPLKSDAGNSRPAGAIFSKDGKLYRPSQDCSISYGYSFDINEILKLSETEYAEKRVRSVRPDWDKTITATHTFGISGNFKIMDAYTSRSRFAKQ